MLSKVDKRDYPSALTSQVLNSIHEKNLMCQLANLNYLTPKLVKILTKLPLCCTKQEVKICENHTETKIFFLIGASSKALVRALRIYLEPNEIFVSERRYNKNAYHAVF